MIYVAIGCAALVLFIWLSRGKPVLKRREWRFLAGALAIACFAAAAYVGVRGGWGKSIVLVVMGLWLVVSTRRTGMGPGPAQEKISDAEARSVLGVGPEADEAEIREAYARLMRMAHPDKGGTSGLAAQLNAARDRLLKKK